MNKKSRIIAIISIICVLFTGTIIVLASQENEFDPPHEHYYQVTAFSEGIATHTCEICGNEFTDVFAEHINERAYEPLDMNGDGIVNAKDYAYLLRNCGE